MNGSLPFLYRLPFNNSPFICATFPVPWINPIGDKGAIGADISQMMVFACYEAYMNGFTDPDSMVVFLEEGYSVVEVHIEY